MPKIIPMNNFPANLGNLNALHQKSLPMFDMFQHTERDGYIKIIGIMIGDLFAERFKKLYISKMLESVSRRLLRCVRIF